MILASIQQHVAREFRAALARCALRQTCQATRCNHPATVDRRRRLRAFSHNTRNTAWAASSASCASSSSRPHSPKTIPACRRNNSSNGACRQADPTLSNNSPSVRWSNDPSSRFIGTTTLCFPPLIIVRRGVEFFDFQSCARMEGDAPCGYVRLSCGSLLRSPRFTVVSPDGVGLRFASRLLKR
jgi:hypothetical protein